MRHLGGEEDAGDGDLRRGVAREGQEPYRRGGRVRVLRAGRRGVASAAPRAPPPGVDTRSTSGGTAGRGRRRRGGGTRGGGSCRGWARVPARWRDTQRVEGREGPPERAGGSPRPRASAVVAPGRRRSHRSRGEVSRTRFRPRRARPRASPRGRLRCRRLSREAAPREAAPRAVRAASRARRRCRVFWNFWSCDETRQSGCSPCCMASARREAGFRSRTSRVNAHREAYDNLRDSIDRIEIQ